MKKSHFQTYISIREDLFLHYNSFSDKYLLLNKKNHQLYETDSIEYVQSNDFELYKKLCAAQFYVNDNISELDSIIKKRVGQKEDTSLYHLVINTTLDCNLKCWYCYETKFKGSQLKPSVVEAIKNNIVNHYKGNNYTTLKISFFGGEPFMNFKAIKSILIYAKTFCDCKNIKLIADFTTNSTLINSAMIDFLKDYNCMFQITLDGDKEQHNKVKAIKGIDTFQLAINNIYKLTDEIPLSKIWVRINYDMDTLKNIDKIYNKLDGLNRKKVHLILRKVWQISCSEIVSEDLLNAIQKGLDNNFIVDCYPLNPNRMCFAERKNQVLVNYDGKIFKCSTLPAFDQEHALGEIDQISGTLKWNNDKLQSYSKTIFPNNCNGCALFGTCYGACTQKMLKHPNGDSCIIEELGLTKEQFLMYNFKLSLQYEKLFR